MGHPVLIGPRLKIFSQHSNPNFILTVNIKIVQSELGKWVVQVYCASELYKWIAKVRSASNMYDKAVSKF